MYMVFNAADGQNLVPTVLYDGCGYGFAGSPTKVKKVENIVFKAKESKVLSGSDADIDSLIGELMANHEIG